MKTKNVAVLMGVVAQFAATIEEIVERRTKEQLRMQRRLGRSRYHGNKQRKELIEVRRQRDELRARAGEEVA